MLKNIKEKITCK